MTVSTVRRSVALCGRDAELATAVAFLRGDPPFVRAEARLLVIEGPSGVGKTRLAREAAETTAGPRRLFLRCDERRSEPGAPITAALEQMSGAPVEIVPGDGGYESRLVERLLQECDYGLDSLIIDDLQWADPTTVEVIRRLIDSIDPSMDRPGLLATARTPTAQVDEGITGLLRHALTARLQLTRLSPEDGQELLISLGAPQTRGDTLAGLVELVDGVPLQLEDLASRLRALGADMGHRIGDLSELASELDLQTDVAVMARARIQDIDPQTRRALAAISVLGGCTESAFVAICGLLEIEDPDLILEEAEDAGFAEVGAQIQIAHPTIAQALLTGSQARSRRLNRTLGQAFADVALGEADQRVATELADLATPTAAVRHLLAGGVAPTPQTIGLGERARASALRHGDWSEVIAAAEWGLDAVEGRELAQLLFDRGVAEYLLGEAVPAVESLSESHDLFAELDDIDGQVYALLGLYRAHGTFHAVFTDNSRLVEIEALLQDWVERLGEERPDLTSDLLADLAFGAWVGWDLRTARERADESLALSPAVGATNAFVRALTCRGLTKYAQTEAASAREDLLRALEVAESATDPTTLISPMIRLPWATFATGAAKDAAREVHEALAQPTVRHTTSQKIFAAGVGVAAYVALGDHQAAASMWASVRNWGAGNGEAMSTGSAGLAYAMSLSVRGETKQAMETLEEALTPLLGPGAMTNPMGVLLSDWVLSEDTDGLSARRPTEPALMPIGGSDVLSVGAAVLSVEHARLRSAEPPERCLSVLANAIEAGQQLNAGVPIVLERSLGLAKALDSNLSAGEQHLRRALTISRAHDLVVEQARVLLDLLEFDLGRDEHERIAWVEALADLVVTERLLGLLPRIDTLDASAGAQVRARLDDRAQPLAEDEAIVMLVDIVDSTRWTVELGSVEFRRRARTVERHLRGAIVAAGGRLGEGVNLGDGVVAEFPSADAAFAAACDIHARMSTSELRVRTGVHTGEVAREGNVISGTAINLAARTSDAARPGGAMVTAATRRSLSSKYQSLTVDEGGFVMKGLAEPMQLYSITLES